MTREELRTHSYKYLTYNTPLSAEHAAQLVSRISLPPNARILDLGCGWAELLLQFLEANLTATATGIDNDNALIDRAITNANERGLHERVRCIAQDAAGTTGEYEFVICIGATHIWPNRLQALKFLHDLISPSGMLLFGDGFWAEEPSATLKEDFGDLLTLSDLHDDMRTSGFEILSSDVATLDEWDEFESAWRSGLKRSANPEAQAFATERKKEYEEGYREVLGFAYIVARKR